MTSIQSVLVTGGAGYVGSVLTKKLLKNNFDVKVIDSLVYGNDGISSLIKENKIEFFNSDIRDSLKISPILKDVDCVIHLAAVVGEPLCKKIPEAARQINLSVPLVVRLAGTNFKEGKEILDKSNLKILSAADLNDAAKKIVEVIN